MQGYEGHNKKDFVLSKRRGDFDIHAFFHIKRL